MSIEQQVVTPSGLSDESGPPVRPRRKRRVALAIGLLLVAIPSAYFGFHWFRTYRFNAECEAARAAEDWYSQRDSARRWVEWEPAAARGWWLAAEAAQKLEDYEDLAYCLGNVPPTDPNALLAYSEKANLEWTVLNRPLDALKTSQMVLRMDPRVLEVQSRVISFYSMNLQRAEMLKAIRGAIAVGAEPRESYAYLILADLLSFTNGGDMNSRWLAGSPDELRFKIALGIHTAMTLASNVDAARTDESVALDDEAMRQLQWFLEGAPDNTALLSYLMYRSYQAGDLERMGQLLQQVGSDSVDDHMIWVFRCWYHTQVDELDDAEAAIREALRIHPLSPLAHHEYANLLRRLERPEVEREQRLAAEGRELRSLLMHLPQVVDLSSELLSRIQSYAEACGDQQVVSALRIRLKPTPIRGLPFSGTKRSL